MADVITFLAGQTLRFHAEVNGERRYVIVEVPEIPPLSYERWADWGPMYRCLLSTNEPLLIHYADRTIESGQRILELESPMLAAVRKLNPFSVKIESADEEIIYELFLGHDGEVSEVKVIDWPKEAQTEPVHVISRLAKRMSRATELLLSRLSDFDDRDEGQATEN